MKDNEKDWAPSKLVPELQMYCDRYAFRYVETYLHRVEAYKYHRMSHRFSDRVAFWYEHYAPVEDAILAAKQWCMRGELERTPPSMEAAPPIQLADGLYTLPDPTLMSKGW